MYENNLKKYTIVIWQKGSFLSNTLACYPTSKTIIASYPLATTIITTHTIS